MMSQIPGEFWLLFVFLFNVMEKPLYCSGSRNFVLTDLVYIYNQENQGESMGFFMQYIENGHNKVTKAGENVVCAYTHKGSK